MINPNTPFLTSDGRVSREWLLFFIALNNAVGGTNTVDAKTLADVQLLADMEDATDLSALVPALGIRTDSLEQLAWGPEDNTGTPSEEIDALVLSTYTDEQGNPSEVQDAFLLANLLPEPNGISRAQPESGITVSASPFTYTAPFDGYLLMTGGTVSQMSFVRNASYATGLVPPLMIPMSRMDQVTVTYSAVPTMVFFPR